MSQLSEALRRKVTKISIEPAGDEFRWSLYDGEHCTFSAAAATDQVPSMLDATRIILQTQLGVMPQELATEAAIVRSIVKPSGN